MNNPNRNFSNSDEKGKTQLWDVLLVPLAVVIVGILGILFAIK